LPQSRVHLGFLLAIIATIIIFYFLWKTSSGFEIRALGESRSAARYKGINTKRVIIVVMIISGAIAGLAGGGEVVGVHHRLRLDISSNFGYTGIIIALLGKLNPIGVLIAAIFFGALVNGSTSMQVSAGVPVALVYTLQSLVLICVITADVLSHYRIRRIRDAE
jgi:simple sugar transport system permease protein